MIYKGVVLQRNRATEERGYKGFFYKEPVLQKNGLTHEWVILRFSLETGPSPLSLLNHCRGLATGG
ncbi:hypothetical protein VHP8226_02105 [Vibrio hippocampi]|uniref:Uncharacterized protein n=1 Tax=Vibrio hippocampi TaxID=654686 RepID=A0ABM8ZIR7_9VIBR|nr:hypothetical protein VHP8226_02105 [Vibrio hippocampi]